MVLNIVLVLGYWAGPEEQDRLPDGADTGERLEGAPPVVLSLPEKQPVQVHQGSKTDNCNGNALPLHAGQCHVV